MRWISPKKRRRRRRIRAIVLLIVLLAICRALIRPTERSAANQSAVEMETDTNIIHSSSQTTQSTQMTVILIKDGRKLRMELEDYLVGVVAAEMPASFGTEALKAQAVAARTYALYCLQTRGEISAGTSDQDWLSEEEMQARWGEHYDDNRALIAEACRETAGEIITYQGTIIESVYHASCGGVATDSAEDVWGGKRAYLISVPCPHGTDRFQDAQVRISKKELCAKLGAKSGKIRITEQSSVGRVKTVAVGDIEMSGTQFRNALGLPSTMFTIADGDTVVITAWGAGHGVGLCQYGARYYAAQGYSAYQILAHYYPHTEIAQIMV